MDTKTDLVRTMSIAHKLLLIRIGEIKAATLTMIMETTMEMEDIERNLTSTVTTIKEAILQMAMRSHSLT